MRLKHATAQLHFAGYDKTDDKNLSGTTWCGEIDNCDVCSRPMMSECYMIGGPAEAHSNAPWGNLCVVCALKYSPRIEWGYAQLYKNQNNKWYLICGGQPEKDRIDMSWLD